MTIKHMMELLVRRGVVFVPPKATVWEADFILRLKSVGTVLVMDGANGEVFLGIVSEQDFAYFLLSEKPARTIPVTKIMTPAEKVKFATPDTTRQQCLALMLMYGVQHLPLLVDGKVVGLVSIRDLAFDLGNILEEKHLEWEGYLHSAS